MVDHSDGQHIACDLDIVCGGDGVVMKSRSQDGSIMSCDGCGSQGDPWDGCMIHVGDIPDNFDCWHPYGTFLVWEERVEE